MISTNLWKVLFAAENQYEETSQFYPALAVAAKANLEKAREAVVEAVLKSSPQRPKQESEVFQSNLDAITEELAKGPITARKNTFTFAELSELAENVTSEPTPEVWEEKARPGHTVEIIEHYREAHYPRARMVTYKHTGVHNKRAQSHPTSTDENRFLKRFRPLLGVPAQPSKEDLQEAKLKAARYEAHTDGVVGPYTAYVIKHGQDRLKNPGLDIRLMTHYEWLSDRAERDYMLDAEASQWQEADRG